MVADPPLRDELVKSLGRGIDERVRAAGQAEATRYTTLSVKREPCVPDGDPERLHTLAMALVRAEHHRRPWMHGREWLRLTEYGERLGEVVVLRGEGNMREYGAVVEVPSGPG